MGGSDKALLAVNESRTDTLISPCNLQGANRGIYVLKSKITTQIPKWDNRDFHVMSPLLSVLTKRGWISPRGEKN